MACRAFIGIGSSLGDRRANVHAAIAQIGALPGTRVVKLSSLYDTEPHGDGKEWYVNAAIEIDTEILPEKLLRRLKEIEKAMGRPPARPNKRWEPRVIDLDILFYDNQIVDTPTLKLPHAEVANRRFVLLPLSELAPQLMHPVLGSSVSQLLSACKDRKRATLLRR